jgi:NAD+ synthase
MMQLNIDSLRIDPADISQQIQDFLKSEVKGFRRDGGIVGLSGGLDSSVVATLAVKTLGADKVMGLIMPERDSHPQSKKDAHKLARTLGIRVRRINLTPLLRKLGTYSKMPGGFWLPYFLPRGFRERYARNMMESFEKEKGRTIFSQQLLSTMGGQWGQSCAYYRVKHRLRMILLYFYAEVNNLLVLGTGNKTELLAGYYVKYGDGAMDVMPILDLYKTQVRQLAAFLKVPANIIDKPPSPDLIPGVTDEFALGITFDELDLILLGLEKGFSKEEISRQLGLDTKKIDYVIGLREDSQHMRELPPCPRFSDLRLSEAIL